MSIDWRARRKTRQRWIGKQLRSLLSENQPAVTERCARCDHLVGHHADVFGKSTRCMLVVEPSDGMRECSCDGFITPESICTCGHRFSEHDEHDDCCSSWCHCDEFMEAPP